MSAAVLIRSATLKQGGAMLCLLAFFAGQSQIFTGLLALAAFAEGSHSVHVAQTRVGDCKLVLSHERGQPGRKNYNPSHSPFDSAHHHGLASRLVCTLAGGTQKLADHVASFSSSSVSEETSRAKLTARACQMDLLVQLTLVSAAPSLPTRSTSTRTFLPCAPPALQVAASTVLLI